MRNRFLALVAIAALVTGAAACGDDDNDDGDETTTTTATTPEAPADGTTEPEEAAGVAITTAETDLGEILVDGEGLTLYVFLSDGPGESTCEDACAEAWPPVPGDDVTDDLASGSAEIGTITRSDGSQQAAIGDRPLYYFVGDEAPGETNGQGLNGVWWVVGPDGEPIEEDDTGS
jgi:predicted lipoprotein with Yx(FWY)xxD motif